jgi:hypothetical protein
MPVTVYRSTDASAPVLSALSGGELVGVLDACLVNGYTGKTAAGWTKSFSGSGRAVYRQGGGNQFYLDFLDNGAGAGGFRETRAWGFEVVTAIGTGTAVSTGTGQFPTSAQSSTGTTIRKSATSDATARPWAVIADDRTFHLLTQAGDTAGWWYHFTFGDIYSYVATDNYRTAIMGRWTENSAAGSSESDQLVDMNSTTGPAAVYTARGHAGTGGSTLHYRGGDRTKGGSGNLIGLMALPNPADGRIWLSPLFIMNVSPAVLRGKFRGHYHFLHTLASVADGDTISGSGIYAGRTFLIFKQSPGAGVHCFDITGPWDTN